MIYTGVYEINYKKKISVSADRGLDVDFKGICMPALANRNVKQSIENDEQLYLYIDNYYNSILKNFDVKDVIKELPNDYVLVDYKNSIDRNIIACWLELELHIDVFDLLPGEFGTIKITVQPEKIKIILNKIIQESKKNQLAEQDTKKRVKKRILKWGK